MGEAIRACTSAPDSFGRNETHLSNGLMLKLSFPTKYISLLEEVV